MSGLKLSERQKVVIQGALKSKEARLAAALKDDPEYLERNKAFRFSLETELKAVQTTIAELEQLETEGKW